MMRASLFILLSSLILYTPRVRGQCPERQEAWERIIRMKKDQISSTEQLKELSALKVTLDSCLDQGDSVYLLLLQRIGVMHYLQGDYFAAINTTQQAIILARNNPARLPANGKRLMNCYNNLQVYFDSLHQVAEKNEMIDSCIGMASRYNAWDENSLRALSIKVEYLLNVGDYLPCIDYAALGETMSKRLGQDYTGFGSQFFSWKVNALLLTYNYPAVAAALENKIPEYKDSHKEPFIGNLYSLWANYYESLGKVDSALDCLQQSYRFNRKLKFWIGCSNALNDIGFLNYDKTRNYNEALRYYKQALKYSDAREMVSILGNMSNVYAKQGRYDSAEACFHRAIRKIGAGETETALLAGSGDYLNNNRTEYIVTLILDKADFNFERFRASGFTNAQQPVIEIYKTADLLLNKIRLQQTEMQSKLFWRKNCRRLYEHAIDACFLSNDTAQALYFFEKSRAVLLSDQLSEQHWMNGETLTKLASLNKQKSVWQNKLVTDSSADDGIQAKAKLFAISQELATTREAIKKDNPLYYQGFIDTSFQSLPELRQTLASKAGSFCELFEGDSSVFLLTIEANHSRLEKMDKKEFDRLSARFTNYLSTESLINADFEGFAATARQLYQLLFKQHSLPPGQIVISPDGPSFPFEALITNAPGNEPRYLLIDHPVSYTYSARYLQYGFSSSTAAGTGGFLGVAPVSYKTNTEMPSLAGSDESLKRIGANFSSYRNQLASAATRSNFMKEFPDYKIVQLYTHAAYNSQQSDPLIYFSDSTLSLSELVTDKKPVAQLIVLAACETAKGRYYAGEGVFSFNRGFAALGIPTCISNLWSVNNEKMYQLTELFYQQLVRGLPLDIALQQAKVEFMKANKINQLPYYWASVILVGKTGAISVTRHTSYWPEVVAAGLAALAFWFAVRRIRKKRGVVGADR